jgi:hypothetical protein
MRYEIRDTNRGAALLVVLFVIMAITVLSLGFLARSDVELACGQNMILRTQMDYLAESGLEHVKGLVLNPQDIASEGHTEATGLQLVAGGDDYYDIAIVRDTNDRCNYTIDCNAYRLQGVEKVGFSSLTAELRLDPCIAYAVRDDTTIGTNMTIDGDVFCDGDLIIDGIVNGDAFATGSITVNGSLAGQENESVLSWPVSSPGLVYDDFSSQYYYDGSGPYSVQNSLVSQYDSNFPGPGGNNPACVYYRDGSLDLLGNINITGMLVVKNTLLLKNNCNLTITAVKNFPALLVAGDLMIDGDNQSLTVTGLAQVNKQINMVNRTSSHVNVMGALCIGKEGIVNADDCTVSINAFPEKAAIETWPTVDTAVRWIPAGGAFLRSIQKK